MSVMKSSGIPWPDINRMIKEEQKANNPLASLIYSINFEKNSVSLMLEAGDDENELSSLLQIDEKYMEAFD